MFMALLPRGPGLVNQCLNLREDRRGPRHGFVVVIGHPDSGFCDLHEFVAAAITGD